MSKNVILLLLKDISWHNPQNVQKKAMDQLAAFPAENLMQAYSFIRYDKDKWQNFVAVISKIGYPKNVKLLPILFELLQDVNWPGANEAIAFLRTLEPEILLPLLKKYIVLAAESKDTMWLGGLRCLAECVCDKDAFLDKAVYDMLQNADF